MIPWNALHKTNYDKLVLLIVRSGPILLLLCLSRKFSLYVMCEFFLQNILVVYVCISAKKPSCQQLTNLEKTKRSRNVCFTRKSKVKGEMKITLILMYVFRLVFTLWSVPFICWCWWWWWRWGCWWLEREEDVRKVMLLSLSLRTTCCFVIIAIKILCIAF